MSEEMQLLCVDGIQGKAPMSSSETCALLVDNRDVLEPAALAPTASGPNTAWSTAGRSCSRPGTRLRD